MAKLLIKNLYKRYENTGIRKRKAKINPYAVDDLTLECNQGEFVALLGPSGCGKTTTLRMIAGLEDITKGDIFIGDVRVNDVPPKDRRIGLAFEDYALYPLLPSRRTLHITLGRKESTRKKLNNGSMKSQG